MGTRKPQGVVPVEALGQGDLFSCSSSHVGTADVLNIKPFDSLEGAGADIKKVCHMHRNKRQDRKL